MIKIVVDSASDFDLEEARKKGIYLLPMEITLKDETFLDGVNLSHTAFFEKLIETDELPKTSQINPYRFEEKLRDSASLWQDHMESVPMYQVGSTIGTHIGPGGIAVAFFSNKK